MNLLHRLSRFKREKITLLIASLALTLGAIFPWYRLPPQALETFGTNLSLANAARVLAALFAILGFAFTFLFNPNRASRLTFWSGLIVVLLFPYFIMTWSPTVAFLAASYYDQGERVSDHVDRNFPEVQAQWKQTISLDQSIPIKSILNLSIQDSRFFQMSSWDTVLRDGFGYSNSFFAFIGRGWSYTVIGIVVSLMGLYLGLEKQGIGNLLKDMSLFMSGCGLLLGIIFLSIIWVNIANHRLDTLFAKGDYCQVFATSQTLASWYPLLRGDESFLERLTKAGFYGNEPEPALINFTMGIERYRVGDFQKAEEYLQKSLDLQPDQFMVRGYLAATLINEGVNYFNISTLPNIHPNEPKPGGAVDHFEQALRIFPGHVEALYDLMLARVVNGEFEKSAETAQQIIEVQQYFQQQKLGLVGQAYLHLGWANYHNGNVPLAWKRYRQSIDNSTWKDSVEVSK